MKRIEINSPRDTKNLIKQLLKNANLSMAKAVKISNENHPDEQLAESNISNKLNRGTLRFDEVYLIALACGYKLIFEEMETNLLNYPQTMRSVSSCQPRTREVIKSKDKILSSLEEKFKLKCMENIIVLASPNFDNVIIAGANAEAAADEYMSRIGKSGNTYQLAKEARIQADISKEYDVMIRCIPNSSY